MNSVHSKYQFTLPKLIAYHSTLILSFFFLNGFSFELEENNDSVQFFYNQNRILYDQYGEIKKSDSLSLYFIDWGESKDNITRLKTYYNYFENSDYKIPKCIKIGNLAYQVALEVNNSEHILKSSMFYISALIKNKDFEMALELIQEMRLLSEKEKLNYYLAKSYLLEGRILQYNNQVKNTLISYLHAVDISERTFNDTLLFKCYESLSWLYHDYNLFAKSHDYRSLQKNIALNLSDSDAFAWACYYDLELYNAAGPGQPMDSLELTFIIDYAKKEKYDRLLNYGFAMFRTHLILLNDSYINCI